MVLQEWIVNNHLADIISKPFPFVKQNRELKSIQSSILF